MSEMIKILCKENGKFYFENEKNIEELIKKLKILILQENDIKILQTLLLTIGNIGKVVEGECLLSILIELLQNLVNKNIDLKIIAYEQLSSIAENKKMKSKFYFLDFF